ncbi:carboxymuconolactone decarboxylase family protein [Dasania marina]|uniref:carboxymuconolactone decarboxylase family protein n=1 Tax=Dasania marina TaxID=471499 RepID=UPI0030D9893A|tara:strand:+ start:8989 stop:9543 length:555 start_codon:yes stop_codon:yes gene_type:complete
MTRVGLIKPDEIDDPIIQEIFSWVTDMEGKVPNHFYVEMNFPEYLKAKLGSTKILWDLGELSMEEIQHVGILVSKANGCDYCTGAFCTVLSYGMNTAESYVEELVSRGVDSIKNKRILSIVIFALKANANPKSVTDNDIDELKTLGLTDKGIVQLVHLVSDFGSYNRLNLSLQTEYDYNDMWRQ